MKLQANISSQNTAGPLAEAEHTPAGAAGGTSRARKPVRSLMPIEAWRELCARTGCSISKGSFYAWIYQGRIKSFHFGGRSFISGRIVDQLVKKALEGKGW